MLLIRHGQSEFNVVYSVTRVDPGIRDPRLTQEGRRQAEATAKIVAAEGVTRLVTSPYTRALETAAIIAAVIGVPISVDPRVGERAAFICDIGTAAPELRTQWPSLELGHLNDLWWPSFEESEAALRVRCEAFRREMAEAPDWRSVAIVSHWGFIRALTGTPVMNCAVLRIDPQQPDHPPHVLSAPPAIAPGAAASG
jgi:broad specificity phosphatase PhoE